MQLHALAMQSHARGGGGLSYARKNTKLGTQQVNTGIFQSNYQLFYEF